LKKTDRILPHHYETATVMFTDFVGFTQSDEVLSTQSLVTQLDECFRAFDAITSRNGLEKIKTIGHAYMAAAGVPHPSSSHAHDCVKAALEIRDFMLNLQNTRTEQHQPHWELRLGIHTGPLVAGVVGTDKFVYDIWGDTVNTAARMESSGIVGKVNISGATHSLIKDQFRCEHRGKIAAKNKGEVDMYIVLGDTHFKSVL
jgi:adenylate cyclase